MESSDQNLAAQPPKEKKGFISFIKKALGANHTEESNITSESVQESPVPVPEVVFTQDTDPSQSNLQASETNHISTEHQQNNNLDLSVQPEETVDQIPKNNNSLYPAESSNTDAPAHSDPQPEQEKNSLEIESPAPDLNKLESRNRMWTKLPK